MSNPVKIAPEMAVAFDFTLTDDDGKVLDTSYDKYPFEYLHGFSQIVRGLEQALEGRTAGDSFTVTIPPEDAYGLHDENNRAELPRDEFEDHELVPGNMLSIMSMSGPMNAIVLSFDDEKVILDSNHELAGKTLHYAVEVLGVRESTFSERTCGHVHDPIASRKST